MKTGLPSGLSALLGRIGINLGQGEKAGEGKVSEKGLQAGGPKDGKGAPGLEKGTVLGDGTVLAGLGHSPHDRKTEQRNVTERANIDRFLLESQLAADGKELPNAARGEDAPRTKDGREPKEPKELRELREELRRDEKLDEAKLQAYAEQKTEKEQKETQDARERERQRDERERERDEEEKPGGAWLQEELEREEQEKKRRGVRDEDALGGYTRCRGHVEDGTQCLRKPVQGTPYCREHAFRHG